MSPKGALDLDEKYASKIEVAVMQKDVSFLVETVTDMAVQMKSVHSDVLILKNREEQHEKNRKEEHDDEKSRKDRVWMVKGAIAGSIASPFVLILLYIVGHAITAVIK
jgi:hypothetical protein